MSSGAKPEVAALRNVCFAPARGIAVVTVEVTRCAQRRDAPQRLSQEISRLGSFKGYKNVGGPRYADIRSYFTRTFS